MLESLLELLPVGEVRELEQELLSGQTPLWQYWEEFVVKNHRLGRSIHTTRSVRDSLRVVVRHLGLLTLEQVNRARELSDALLDLKERKQHSPVTTASYIKDLNTYFIWLERNEYIAKNHIRKIERPKGKGKEKPVITQAKIETVLAYLKDRDYRNELERKRDIFYIDMLRFTGARPCELLGMTTESIYFQQGQWRVAVNGKKQKGRVRYYTCPQYLQNSYFDKIKRDAFIFRLLTYMQTTSN